MMLLYVDDIIHTAKHEKDTDSAYPHGWVDNYGKSKWEQWHSFAQENNGTIWSITLFITTDKNGSKRLYDIDRIKKIKELHEADSFNSERIGQSSLSLANSHYKIISQPRGNVNTPPAPASIADVSDGRRESIVGEKIRTTEPMREYGNDSHFVAAIILDKASEIKRKNRRGTYDRIRH